ncbi:hypothetical protein GQ600_12049 [Phytophthora cactorum]|nr:hypothetical protein GQ600_12049 [Phytophthora cactorum]
MAFLQPWCNFGLKFKFSPVFHANKLAALCVPSSMNALKSH